MAVMTTPRTSAGTQLAVRVEVSLECPRFRFADVFFAFARFTGT